MHKAFSFVKDGTRRWKQYGRDSAWMSASGYCMLFIVWAVSSRQDAGQGVCVRVFCIDTCAYYYRRRGYKTLKTNNFSLHILRSLIIKLVFCSNSVIIIAMEQYRSAHSIPLHDLASFAQNKVTQIPLRQPQVLDKTAACPIISFVRSFVRSFV